MAKLLGALLIELGHKVQEAGIDRVRILTDEEVEEDQVRWYRRGWEEHARAADPQGPEASSHPSTGDFSVQQGRLIQFPAQPGEGEQPQPHPLPIVGAGDAAVRDLMPHRPRSRPSRERGDDG
ncbi:hypothetical protein [Streptomyces sp. NPDC088246]|uniref:hypothetical protein n=1 Tax=Streptomyces sp. NPDC088246 TaxID=3365842 RepID=UPI00381E7102